MIQKRYPAKVLLFGEYTVLLGGKSLAMPFPKFNGHWTSAQSSGNAFLRFANYLQEINNSLNAPLHFQDLMAFWEHGASFESSIPVGIGLGSSAALSASIYDKFSAHNFLGLHDKMEDLALIESYFHGKSSGFDALVSLLQTPILRQNDEIIQLKKRPESSLFCYLLFTNKERHTEKLVDWFRKECLDVSFHTKILQMSSLVNQCIDDYISGNGQLYANLRKLSQSQFTHLNDLIVPEIQELWASSLDSDQFIMKICGAGGGGCYLVLGPKPLIPNTLAGFPIQQC